MIEINELNIKRVLKDEIRKVLKPSEIKEAERDHHAHRKPRPCGFTIHTGIGCSLKCLYCYIGDMGFPWSIKEYPLNGYQLVYALLVNPYFIPGGNGSLIAIGSVTEPFHGVTRHKTFDYIEKISKYLKNPIQFSTKMYLSLREAETLAKNDKGVSPLITIISLKYAKKLEPYVPSPEKRYEAISNLRRAGLKPFLFLRPIIPGIIEDDYMDIIDKAREYGAVGVVAGSLRITLSIIKRLKNAGLPVDEILRRAPRKPRGKEQVSIDTSDLKNEIRKYVIKNKLIFFPEACMANLYTHRKVCWKMIRLNLVTDKGSELRYPSRNDIEELAEKLNVDLEEVKLRDYEAILWLSKRSKQDILLSELIHSRYRICVKLRYY